MKGRIAIGALFALIDFARIEGPGINVNAHGALIKFREIQNLMDGFQRIDVDRMRAIHFVDFGGVDVAGAQQRVPEIDAEVLNFKAADGCGHPAVLVAMIVNAAGLADFPTDGHALEKIVFEDEIAGVVAPGEIDVLLQRFWANGIANQKILDVFQSELAFGDAGEIFYPVCNVVLLRDDLIGHDASEGQILICVRSQ